MILLVKSVGIATTDCIGLVQDDSMNLFQWDKAAMSLLAIFVIVILAEIVVVNIRKRLL
jgi:phosphonate transport system permease protein